MQTINVTGVESKTVRSGQMITILSDNLKYSFFSHKQDGTESKAYEGFQKLRPQIGDTLQAEIKEEEKSFVNGQGKTINFTDRRIMYFNTSGESMETNQAPRVQEDHSTCEETFQAIRKAFAELTKRVKDLEDKQPVGDLAIEDINFGVPEATDVSARRVWEDAKKSLLNTAPFE